MPALCLGSVLLVMASAGLCTSNPVVISDTDSSSDVSSIVVDWSAG